MNDEVAEKLQVDNWDRHWDDFTDSLAVNPAPGYRRKLIWARLEIESAAAPRLLDVGSGVGDFLVDADGYLPHAAKLGLELSESGVKLASRRLPQAAFLQRDLLGGHQDPGEFRDFATHAVCSEVLEHVDDPVRLLRNARPYMADGCRLVVTVPGGPRSAFDLHIGHRRHFTPQDLRRVIEDAGFTVEHATGAGFPFFNLYRMLVILRGKHLIQEARSKPGAAMKFTSAVFRVLFHFNLAASPLGWQTIAVARK